MYKSEIINIFFIFIISPFFFDVSMKLFDPSVVYFTLHTFFQKNMNILDSLFSTKPIEKNINILKFQPINIYFKTYIQQ